MLLTQRIPFGVKKLIFIVLAILVATPLVNPAMSLIAGVLVALFMGNPWREHTVTLAQKMLMYSVIGLGAGMNLQTVAVAGVQGLGYTAVSIAATMTLGWLLGRFLQAEREASLLITFGTAICGGSAVAALAPVIKAKSQSITVALAVVFILNALALLLFPSIGHELGFSERQFGLWIALAVHDTSSVVGTGLQYGPQALQIGTTVKLARALWIVPIVLAAGLLQKGKGGRAKIPWFILGFLVLAALVTFLSPLNPHVALLASWVEGLSRRGLVLTLFLIGANLTPESLREVGWRPLVQGLVLWIVVASLSALAICNDWMS